MRDDYPGHREIASEVETMACDWLSSALVARRQQDAGTAREARAIMTRWRWAARHAVLTPSATTVSCPSASP